MNAVRLLYCTSLLIPVHLHSNDEVDPHYKLIPHAHGKTDVIYIFAHGLGATQEQALPFCTDSEWVIHTPLVLFNFPDALGNDVTYKHDKVNLGQELDMERLRWVYEKTVEQYPDCSIVLCGVSRGAATVINFVASHKPAAVKAIVLESPFDTFENVANHLLKRFHVGWIPFSKSICLRLIRKYFPLLDVNGICPAKTIGQIPRNISILLMHSRRDKTIPVHSSRSLYKALVNAGHPQAYFLESASGEHAKNITRS